VVVPTSSGPDVLYPHHTIRVIWRKASHTDFVPKIAIYGKLIANMSFNSEAITGRLSLDPDILGFPDKDVALAVWLNDVRLRERADGIGSRLASEHLGSLPPRERSGFGKPQLQIMPRMWE
jgi:hypothetical protein